jgi:replicative DNA helicase
MEDITKFMADLESEVKGIADKTKQNEAKARLEKAMLVYSGEDELISSLDILERIKTQPEEEKFMTGIEGLDNILKGFRKNQLIVLAAPTKSGKSQMTVELAIRMKETSPVFIPFEESAEELVRKFHDRNETPPLFYTPKNITGNTISWIEKKVVEGIVKFNSKLFFIDHLHFIVPFSSDRLDTRIGQVMRDLKKIAKDHGVMIVIVAHLKKTNMVVSPTLEDLRDSSFIAQEADTVLMMWRAAERVDGEMHITNKTLLSVQANRRTGNTGTVKLVFVNGRFLEQDWKLEEKVTMNGKEYVF